MAGGVYPRVGGGTLLRGAPETAAGGLSPRGRGNLCLAFAGFSTSRSIPAWAGEPVASPGSPGFYAVYPRVGGGTAPGGTRRRGGVGLSPRGRGNPVVVVRVRVGAGSIPAWAGEPVTAETGTGLTGVYPRVGGGTGGKITRVKKARGISPRGRGNQ